MAVADHMLRPGRLEFVAPPADERRHYWLERIIFSFDRSLRRWQSVVEFTSDPSCILRIRVGRLDRDIVLADGTCGHAGERFVDLHLWNEQVPAMPSEGASIAWARHMHVCFRQSLAQLARYLAERPDLNDISVVRCGFERVPADNPLGLGERARRFAENILISLIVLARNAASLRRDTLRRGRTRVFMSRRLLERRYAGGNEAEENVRRAVTRGPDPRVHHSS